MKKNVRVLCILAAVLLLMLSATALANDAWCCSKGCGPCDLKDAAKAATCKDDGIKEGTFKCKDCGTYYVLESPCCYKKVSKDDVTISHKKIAHTWKDVEGKAPTCTESGYTDYKKCTVCGATEGKEELAKKPHEWKDVPGLKPTCLCGGWTDYKVCKNCCATEGFKPLDKLGHDWKDVPALKPTCLCGGWEAYKVCARCLLTSGFKPLDKLGHDWKEIPAKEPTCLCGGWEAYKMCKRCFMTDGFKPLDKLGHDWETKPGKAPTCTEGGWTEYKQCKRCGAIEGKKLLDKLGHDWEIIPGKEPTCLEGGWTEYKKCKRCGEIEGYKELPPLGHKWKWYPKKDPTCKEKGYTSYKQCERCGEIVGYTELDLLAHVYGPWIPDEPADPMTHTSHCLVCEDKATVPCEFTQITIIADKDGETEEHTYEYCPVCGNALMDGTQIEALPVVEGASAQAAMIDETHKGRLPWGDFNTFMQAAPYANDETILFVLTTGIEKFGSVVPLIEGNPAVISFPVESEKAFKIQQVEMLPDPENEGELIEVRTEIPYDLVDGVVTFTVANNGLFILVDAE